MRFEQSVPKRTVACTISLASTTTVALRGSMFVVETLTIIGAAQSTAARLVTSTFVPPSPSSASM